MAASALPVVARRRERARPNNAQPHQGDPAYIFTQPDASATVCPTPTGCQPPDGATHRPIEHLVVASVVAVVADPTARRSHGLPDDPLPKE